MDIYKVQSRPVARFLPFPKKIDLPNLPSPSLSQLTNTRSNFINFYYKHRLKSSTFQTSTKQQQNTINSISNTTKYLVRQPLLSEEKKRK